MLEFSVERLDANAKLRYTGVFAGLQDGRGYIVRMQFNTDAFGDDEMLADGCNYLRAVCK